MNFTGCELSWLRNQLVALGATRIYWCDNRFLSHAEVLKLTIRFGGNRGQRAGGDTRVGEIHVASMRSSFPLTCLVFVSLLVPAKGLAQASAQKGASGNAIPATYATKAEAERAAKQFHCTGAHQMGDRWMPCNTHGDAHSH